MKSIISMLITGGGKITCARCIAKSKRSGEQCRKPALKSSRNQKCQLHGGRSTEPKTAAGKARIAAVHTLHGGATRAKRAERSASSAEISRLEDAMHALKMTTSPRSRGRKAAGYKPVNSIADVMQIALDDLLQRNTQLKDDV